jgi:hypothetical protein
MPARSDFGLVFYGAEFLLGALFESGSWLVPFI